MVDISPPSFHGGFLMVYVYQQQRITGGPHLIPLYNYHFCRSKHFVATLRSSNVAWLAWKIHQQ